MTASREKCPSRPQVDWWVAELVAGVDELWDRESRQCAAFRWFWSGIPNVGPDNVSTASFEAARRAAWLLHDAAESVSTARGLLALHDRIDIPRDSGPGWVTNTELDQLEARRQQRGGHGDT